MGLSSSSPSNAERVPSRRDPVLRLTMVATSMPRIDDFSISFLAGEMSDKAMIEGIQAIDLAVT